MANYIKINSWFKINQSILPDEYVFGMLVRDSSNLTLCIRIEDKNNNLAYADSKILTSLQEENYSNLICQIKNDGKHYFRLKEDTILETNVKEIITKYKKLDINIIDEWELK